jgi:hypothetical protein
MKLPGPGVIAVLFACAAAGSAAWLTGPPGFDSIDGAEFAVAGQNMAVAHPPSYPLYLSLLRVFPGGGYDSCRALSALLAAMCVPAGYAFLRRRGSGRTAALASTMLLLTSAPVLSQMNCAEVHALALLLCLAGLASAGGRLGPYAASLSVFGGHPMSILALPTGIRRARFPSIGFYVLPASLLLYVPLAAGGAWPSHYGRPSTLTEMASYLTMYGQRLSPPSALPFLETAASVGPATLALLALLLAFSGRPRPGELVSLALAGLAMAVYRVPDPVATAWVLLIPVWSAASRGMNRICSLGRPAAVMAVSAVAVSAVAGVDGADRTRDGIAGLLSRDMMRSVPFEAVYCTIGHDTFHAAYLLALEDRRPDVIPVDLYGNYFELRIASPLPSRIGSRPVAATRAWDETGFELCGLVFLPSGAVRLDWERMDVFGADCLSPDGYAMDALAEAWARRAIQSEGAERDGCAGRALDLVRSPVARERIGAMLGHYR